MFNAVESGSIEAVDILLTNGAGTDVVDEVSKIYFFTFLLITKSSSEFVHLNALCLLA